MGVAVLKQLETLRRMAIAYRMGEEFSSEEESLRIERPSFARILAQRAACSHWALARFFKSRIHRG